MCIYKANHAMIETRQIWIDPTTRAVVGVDRYLSHLDLVSEIGRKNFLTSDDDRHSWLEESERLLEVEGWLSSSKESEILRLIAACPRVDEQLRKLKAGSALDEPALFGVKRLLYHCECIAEHAPPHFEVDIGEIRRIREAIHPQKKPGPSFRLVDELDDELAASRKALHGVKKLERGLRRTLEAEVLGAVSGKFDVRGILRPEQPIPEGLPLLEVPGGQMLWSKELDEARSAVESAQEDVEAHEVRVRSALSRALADSLETLVMAEAQVGDLDHRVARCRLRADFSGTWPTLSDEVHLSVEEGRSPGFDEAQPISFTLRDAPVVVMGPNMGGKSALLRMAGLAAFCGHHHLPFPADAMSFRWSNGIVYIGSEEPNAPALTEGLSAFGREVKRVVECLKRSPGSLWLLDEVGRGTHPSDGAKILSGIIEALARRGDTVIASTHFADVDIDGEYWRIRGIRDERALEAELADSTDVKELLRRYMDYQPESVEAGATPPRGAWLIARALGLELDD